MPAHRAPEGARCVRREAAALDSVVGAGTVSGSVTTLTIARGNMINDPTQSIMTVADLSTVWVTALVPEKDVAAVAKDQDAEVALSAYPGRVLHGKVLFISDIIEPDSRRDKLRIAFPNADVSLKPNMFATVTLAGPKETRVILPTSALPDEQRQNLRVCRHRALDLRAPHRRSTLEEGPTVTLGSGVKDGEEVGGQGRNSPQ